MSTLNALRAGAVGLIEGGNLGFKEVRKHVGRYSLADLEKLHTVAPACAVGFINFGKPRRRASGQFEVDAALAAVIVAHAGKSDDADEAGVMLATGVVALLGDWVPSRTVPYTTLARDVHAEPLSADELDGAKLIVWTVMWSHTVTIGKDQVGAAIDETQRLGSDLAVTTINPQGGDVPEAQA